MRRPIAVLIMTGALSAALPASTVLAAGDDADQAVDNVQEESEDFDDWGLFGLLGLLGLLGLKRRRDDDSDRRRTVRT